jgi:hypothetical protein
LGVWMGSGSEKKPQAQKAVCQERNILVKGSGVVNNFGEKVNFIWSVADLLRGPYRPNQYKDVMLPMTVLRRLDCVLGPTKEKVLEKAKDVSQATIAHLRWDLRQIFRMAVNEGLLVRNPAELLHIPKRNKAPERRVLTIHQTQQAMLSRCGND